MKLLDTWQTDSSMVTSSAASSRLASSKSLLRFEDIRLGILIRATPSGRFFRGTWNGAAVVVKVMERFLHECVEAPGGGAPVPEEALVCCSHAHPTLVRSYGFAARVLQGAPATDGQPWSETWLVLEAFDQGTLANKMAQGMLREQGKAFDAAAIVATMRDVAGAVSHLHSAGLVHGHLSADCVWLMHAANSRGWVAKVADFGLSRNSTGFLPLTAVAHAPPELMLKGIIHEAGDVYALGVMMYEVVHLHRMWQGKSLTAVLQAFRRHRTPKCTANMPELYVGLTNLCLSEDPELRPAAKALQRALNRFARQEFGRGSPPQHEQNHPAHARFRSTRGQEEEQQQQQQQPESEPSTLLDTSTSKAASRGIGRSIHSPDRHSLQDAAGDAPVKRSRWWCCFLA